MHLNVGNLAHFLIHRGLLDTDTVVTGDLTIVDSSRRNRNFKVTSNAGLGLFVKHIRQTQADGALALRREATCYGLAGDDPVLSRLMPRLISYDADRNVLITELIGDAENLFEYHQRLKIFPTDVGLMLGEGLGSYHAQAEGRLQRQPSQALFAREVPVILTLGRAGHSALDQLGHIGPALASVIQQHEDFRELLDALGAEWRFDSLIHGDIKWDNVLVYPGKGGLDFRIVDWELADFGDAAWDVGAVFQSFLVPWILSMPIASGLPPETYIDMASEPIEDMRPVLHAFWRVYAARRGFDDVQRNRELERCLRFGAARLVWAALELRFHSAQLDPASTALLQVSHNILKDPSRAVGDLLGV